MSTTTISEVTKLHDDSKRVMEVLRKTPCAFSGLVSWLGMSYGDALAAVRYLKTVGRVTVRETPDGNPRVTAVTA